MSCQQRVILRDVNHEPRPVPVPTTSSVEIREMSEAEFRFFYGEDPQFVGMITGPMLCSSSLVNRNIVLPLPNGSPFANGVPPYVDYRDYMQLFMSCDMD